MTEPQPAYTPVGCRQFLGSFSWVLMKRHTYYLPKDYHKRYSIHYCTFCRDTGLQGRDSNVWKMLKLKPRKYDGLHNKQLTRQQPLLGREGKSLLPPWNLSCVNFTWQQNFSLHYDLHVHVPGNVWIEIAFWYLNDSPVLFFYQSDEDISDLIIFII